MVIVFRNEEWSKETININGAKIYNVPVKRGMIGKVPDEAKGIDKFIEKHNIESMDWQDWLDILQVGIEEWERENGNEWYRLMVEQYEMRVKK